MNRGEVGDAIRCDVLVRIAHLVNKLLFDTRNDDPAAGSFVLCDNKRSVRRRFNNRKTNIREIGNAAPFILAIATRSLRAAFNDMTRDRPRREPVPIVVPDLKVELPPASVVFSDGSLSCLNHQDARAIVKCVKCEKAFCEECVHVLRLAGGKRRVFCPACSGHCESLPGTTTAVSLTQITRPSFRMIRYSAWNLSPRLLASSAASTIGRSSAWMWRIRARRTEMTIASAMPAISALTNPAGPRV